MNIAAMIIGVAGLVAWLEPKIGFFVSYLAFFLGYLGNRKKRSVLPVVAMILGGTGFLLSLVHLVLSVTLLR